MASVSVQQFFHKLKSKNEDARNKAAWQLYFYVKIELREVSQEEIASFMDNFN